MRNTPVELLQVFILLIRYGFYEIERHHKFAGCYEPPNPDPNELNMSAPMVTNAYNEHHITMIMVQHAQLWNATALVTSGGGKRDQGPSFCCIIMWKTSSFSLAFSFVLGTVEFGMVWKRGGEVPQFVYL